MTYEFQGDYIWRVYAVDVKDQLSSKCGRSFVMQRMVFGLLDSKAEIPNLILMINGIHYSALRSRYSDEVRNAGTRLSGFCRLTDEDETSHSARGRN